MDREGDPTALLLQSMGMNQSFLTSNQIVARLADSDPSNVLEALEDLSSILLMSQEDVLLTFPTNEALRQLVRILAANTPYAEIPVLAARVITQLIDRGIPEVLEKLVDSGVLDALHTRFQDIAYVDIVEQAIVILERVAHKFPAEVLTSGCPVLCLQYIDFFNMHIQKSILTVVAICSSAITSENIDTIRVIVPILQEHLTGCSQTLIDLSLTGMCLVIQAVAKRVSDPKQEIRAIFNEHIAAVIAARITPDDPLLSKAIKATNCLLENMPQLVPESIKNHVPLAISYALTNAEDITKPDSYDQNSVVSSLLHCSKDATSSSIHLLGNLLPAPKLDRPYTGAYQRPNGVEKSLLADVPIGAIEELAGTIIQMASLVHSSSADLSLRQQALANVLAFANGVPKKIIKSTSAKLDIVSLVCMVISQADTLPLTIGGLEICAELTSKLPEVFVEAFIRQGIVSELDAIIEACPEPNNLRDWSFDSSKEQLEPVASFIALAIKENLKGQLQNTPVASTHALDLLKNGDTCVWPEIATIIHDRSMFELLRLGAFDTIADAILADQDSFMAAFNSIQFRELVSKLEDATTRTERCSVLATSGDHIVSLTSALSRHIRIRLKDKDLKTSWSINVQGIASIKNLEEFCQDKLALFQFVRDDNLFAALNRARENHDSQEDDDDDDDDDDDEEEEEEDAIEDEDEDEEHDEDQIHIHHELSESSSDEDHSEDHSGDIRDDHGSRNNQSALLDDSEMDFEDQVRVNEPRGSQDGSEASEGEGLVEVRNRDNDDDAITSEMLISRALGRIRSEATNSERPCLQFYYNDRPLYADMSVLGAIYSQNAKEDDYTIPRSMWTEEFTITFERTEKSAENKSVPDSAVDTFRELPKSLGSNPQLKSAIRLLNILHVLNEKNHVINSSEFVNMKLTSKLNRQLDDPLVVIANILPQWAIDTVRMYPFLYPFETRYLFVKSTSFGYSRSMSRWQSQDEQHLQAPRMSMGRAVKQKYRISRKGLLANALKVLNATSKMAAIVEIEYYGEQGTGLGPTLEFYSSVSKEFQRKDINMWRGESISDYMFDPNGLFPAPMDARDKTVLNLFTGLGRFFARSLLDERLMDLRISPAFFILVLGHDFMDQRDILRLVDPEFAANLLGLDKSNVEKLELDFTLPSYDDIELLEGGRDQLVTGARLQEYQDLVVDWTVGKGVSRQIEAFKQGFAECISLDTLSAFLPADFEAICGQNQESWDIATLRSSIKADHGYTAESQPVTHLLELMAQFNPEQRRRFLQFMTGSPNLPIGGFKRLDPAFTVVLKQIEDESLHADDYFPSVMTCANYLKLPAYSDRDVMSRKLWEAIEGGSGHFPLS